MNNFQTFTQNNCPIKIEINIDYCLKGLPGTPCKHPVKINNQFLLMNKDAIYQLLKEYHIDIPSHFFEKK